jgi:hypothetical protein
MTLPEMLPRESKERLPMRELRSFASRDLSRVLCWHAGMPINAVLTAQKPIAYYPC